MSALNRHYEAVGRVLAHLVSHGLGRIDLSAEEAPELLGIDLLAIDDEDERDEQRETAERTLSDILAWMHREGLISAREIHEFDDGALYGGAQLTSRGLAVIGMETFNTGERKSIGDVVQERKGEIDAKTYIKIGSFVGGILGGFTKSIS